MSEKPLLSSFDIDGLVEYIKSERCKKITFMVGAGISVSAGIPDFRSPGTGLYYTLQEYNLPDPMSIFSIDYLKENPTPFYSFQKNLIPGIYKPTPTHYFMKLIEQKNLLGTIWTQNIDGLEHLAGVPEKKIYECHGSFWTFHCLKCQRKSKLEEWRDKINKGEVLKCKSTQCLGLVKPDVVFFGENLPKKVFEDIQDKVFESDLILIIGTSLAVTPFSGFFELAARDTVRVLINREAVGTCPIRVTENGGEKIIQVNQNYQRRFFFQCPEINFRDIFLQGDCDDVIYQICDKLGWRDELDQLISQ